MRRLVVLLTCAFALLAGAVAPAAHAQAVQPIAGRLLDPSGKAVGGAPVIVNENRGIASAIVGGVAAVFSLGLACAAHVDPCRSSGSAATQTGADGRFSFTAAQVASARKTSRGVIVIAGDAATTGSAAVKVNPTVGGDLGDVALWDPAAAVSSTAGGWRVRWAAPPGANSQTELHGVVLREGERAGVLAGLEQKGTRGDEVVDPRALEDAAGSLWLSAGFSRTRANQNARVDWLAPPVKIQGAGVPLSRGAPCVVASVPLTASPCQLTDGDLSTVAISAATTVTVDLRQPTKVGLVAARPNAQSASVSTDGTRWVPLAPRPAIASWPATLWDVEGTWRYVRVDVGAQSGSAQLSEISVWPPGKSVTPPAAVSTPNSPASPRSPHRRHLPTALIVIALVLAGMAAAGVVRRRRRL